MHPLPARIIEKGLASDRVVIDTVVSKYADHLPLYRQSVMLERETGIELSRATLDGWVMRVGELLRPITGAMPLELLAGNYIQADETPLGVQSERVRGKNYEAYEITTTTSDLENSDLSLLLGRVIHWKRP